jgi:hypothetical protein
MQPFPLLAVGPLPLEGLQVAMLVTQVLLLHLSKHGCFLNFLSFSKPRSLLSDQSLTTHSLAPPRRAPPLPPRQDM